MDHDEYIKMMVILSDGDKFKRLRPDKTHDWTKSIELNFQKGSTQFG